MTYADQWRLAYSDPEFAGRVNACGVEQAQVFINDGRPEYVALAREILTNGAVATLVVNVAARPDMDADIDDPGILAAVQYVWPLIGATLVPPG